MFTNIPCCFSEHTLLVREVRFLKRHLISSICVFFVVLVVFSWYRSSRVWTSHTLQLPVMRLQVFSESSQLVVRVGISDHAIPTGFQTRKDEIWGDHMQFIGEWPKILSQEPQSIGLFIPHWQVVLALLGLGTLIFVFETRLLKKRLSER